MKRIQNIHKSIWTEPAILICVNQLLSTIAATLYVMQVLVLYSASECFTVHYTVLQCALYSLYKVTPDPPHAGANLTGDSVVQMKVRQQVVVPKSNPEYCVQKFTVPNNGNKC